MFVGSDIVITGTQSASLASPNGGMVVVTTQDLRAATLTRAGGEVPRGGLGLSLRTAPKHELP